MPQAFDVCNLGGSDVESSHTLSLDAGTYLLDTSIAHLPCRFVWVLRLPDPFPDGAGTAQTFNLWQISERDCPCWLAVIAAMTAGLSRICYAYSDIVVSQARARQSGEPLPRDPFFQQHEAFHVLGVARKQCQTRLMSICRGLQRLLESMFEGYAHMVAAGGF